MPTSPPDETILKPHALAALSMGMKGQPYRIGMLVLWGLGLSALTDAFTALVWTALALVGALTRRWGLLPAADAAKDATALVVEREIVAPALLRALLWAAAPLLIMNAGRDGALAAALLYLAAGATLFAMQFRSAIRAIAIVCAPLVAAGVVIIIMAAGQGAGPAAALGFLVFAAALLLQVGLARRVERQMEGAAHENRQLLLHMQLAVDSIAAAPWHLDFRTRALTGGEAMSRLYQRDLTWSDVVVPGTPYCHPDDQPKVAAAIAALTPDKPRDHCDHRVLMPGGGVIWLRTTAMGTFNRNGVLKQLSGLTFDVTAQKRTELEVLNATLEAEAALANQRRLFDDPGLPATPARAPAAAGTLEDSVHHLRMIVTEIAERDASLAQIIDDLARARTAAEQASTAKSQFLANMSHELRTPLNAIMGYGELLQESARERGDAEAQDDLRRLLAAAQRLLHLINDVLDLSRIEAGRMDLNAQTFPVPAMLEDILSTVRPMVRPGVKLLEDFAPGLGEATTDKFRLSQALLNLLSNAAKFTSDGVILVSARRELRGGEEWLVFSVRDSGIGIAPEALDRLFKPFSQANAAVSGVYGGTGLGLAITRRLARLMGGDVTALSTPEVGSTFTLTLPVRLPEEMADAA